MYMILININVNDSGVEIQMIIGPSGIPGDGLYLYHQEDEYREICDD